MCGCVAGLATAGAGPADKAAPDPTPALLGSITWVDGSPEFGGISGLSLGDDGRTFFAVSDAGLLLQARLERDADGVLTAVNLLAASRFKDNFGRPAEGFQSDAEAIRAAADGSLLVAFEGYARVARFTPPDMMPAPLHEWDRFRDLWGNQGMEALAIDDAGQTLTILEEPQPDGAYRALAYGGGKGWSEGAILPSDGQFSATDADFGPDGRLYVLERSFSVLWGYQSRISAYVRDGGTFAPPQVLLLTGQGEWGDFEGMDVWTNPQGRTVATLVADNNFLTLSPTTIAEFDLSARTGLSGDE